MTQRAPQLRDPFANDHDEAGPSFGPSSQRASNNGSSASTSSAAAAPRALGLSLGLPRSRMAAQRGQTDKAASVSGDKAKADEAVRNTDSDALLSRLSALKLGYLDPEPFTQEFSSSLPSNTSQIPGAPGLSRPQMSETPSARRSPLINIGTYLRCTAIDAEVESFLTQGEGQKQIISIGAGSDSRYWRAMSNPDLSNRMHHYVELDFEQNTSTKLSHILKSTILRSFLDPNSTVHGIPLTDLPQHHQDANSEPLPGSKRFDVLRSSKYTLLAADVRALHPDTPAADRIDADHLFGLTELKSDLPTLILFECVLAYIAPDKADWLIHLLGQRFADAGAVSYDIALAGDADVVDAQETADPGSQASITPSRFGRVMLQNLEMRRLSLPGAKAYPTINAQSQRFVRAWSGSTSDASTANEHLRARVEASGKSLFSIWSSLDAVQKSRLSRLEGLDEVEEMDMLLKHYCIVRARRSTLNP